MEYKDKLGDREPKRRDGSVEREEREIVCDTTNILKIFLIRVYFVCICLIKEFLVV